MTPTTGLGMLDPNMYAPGVLNQSQMNPALQSGENMARDRALNAGLMSAGAGLLAAPSLSEGLAAGLQGFNKAYDTSLVANRPKVTPLADGAFSQISFPDGTVQIVQNKDVEKFIMDKEKMKTEAALNRIVVGSQASGARQAELIDYKGLLEEAGGPNASAAFNPTVQEGMARLDNIEAALKGGLDVIAGREMPVVANAIDQTYGRIFGTKDYSVRRDLNEFLGKSVLEQAQFMKGALSDGDRRYLEAMQPKQDDPIDRKLRYVQEFKKRMAAEENRRIAAAKKVQENQARRGAGGAPGTSTVPPSTKAAPKPAYSPTGNADDASFFD